MAEDTEQSRSDEIERLRMKYGFLKFLLGTFAISAVSIWINYHIQTKKLEFDIQTKENEFIAQFLVFGLEGELEDRRDFAEYFVRLSPVEDSRERWRDYLSFVQGRLDQASEAVKAIEEHNRQFGYSD